MTHAPGSRRAGGGASKAGAPAAWAAAQRSCASPAPGPTVRRQAGRQPKGPTTSGNAPCWFLGCEQAPPAERFCGRAASRCRGPLPGPQVPRAYPTHIPTCRRRRHPRTPSGGLRAPAFGVAERTTRASRHWPRLPRRSSWAFCLDCVRATRHAWAPVRAVMPIAWEVCCGCAFFGTPCGCLHGCPL